MIATSASLDVRRRAVRLWLIIVAVAIVVTLLVGGATRLTESGLSIVEWKPVTGVLPPMSDAAWQAEFDKYRATPQYREINRGMSLDSFKTIFWWEWSHRFLARTVGAIFLLPFIWFLWRGLIEPGLRARLWAIFGAGAMLGAVGWWMVASGLVGRTSVSQYRLAFHMTLACAIFAAIVWTAARMRGVAAGRSGGLSLGASILALLVLLQIYLGALVAGLDAGLTYNTWPLIDGAIIPASGRLWFETPWWRNLFENTLTVQFNHRMLAYAIWAGALWHVLAARHADKRTRIMAWHLAGLITLQAVLGIVTLLHQAPLHLALAHQALAIAVLTAAVLHAARLVPHKNTTRSGVSVEQGA